MSQNFVTGMVTRDLLAIANLLVRMLPLTCVKTVYFMLAALLPLTVFRHVTEQFMLYTRFDVYSYLHPFLCGRSELRG